jgi:hypothetical protein
MGVAKVLVVGAIQGHLTNAFNKITKLHTKQSFSFAIIVGDVFGKGADIEADLDALLNGEIKVPLPTYFSVGDQALPTKVAERLESSDEVVSNLIYAGRKGTFTTAEGIRVVTVGGRLVENDASVTQGLGKTDPLFLSQDTKSLKGAHSAHILLTNQWPGNIHRLSQIDVPEGVDIEAGAHPLAELNQALKPWYHFSSSPSGMWEREVFQQKQEYDSLEEPKYTRFKSLASVANPTKEWVSAFSLDTSRPPPAETWTKLPFLTGSPPRKRPRLEDQDQAYNHHNGGGGGHRGRKRGRYANSSNPNDCFMCVGKADFKEHMVVSIGSESVLSILRGPLPESTTFPQLTNFSGHSLIIPMYHAFDEISQGRRPQEELQTEFDEMTLYRKALNRMVGAKANGELGTVCYEVNRIGIRHFHWQLLPVEADKIKRGLVQGAFKLAAENRKYGTFQDCDPDELLEERNNFFRVWIWRPSTNPVEKADQEANGAEGDCGKTTSMFFKIPEEGKFNVQFGREVMAGILQLEDRVDWRTCLMPEAEELAFEQAEAEAFKEGFAEFDFAM